MSSPSNWMLQLTSNTFKFTSLPSSLGNCPAKEVTILTRNLKSSDRMLSGLPSRPHANILSCLRFVSAPHSDGIPPVNLCDLKKRLPLMLSTSSETGSSLGSSPERCKCQQNTKPLRPGTNNLTVEFHAVQLQFLELRKDCHVRCNRPAQLVAAKRELFEICKWRK